MKKTKTIIFAIIFICLDVFWTSLVFYNNDLNDEVLLNSYEETKSKIDTLNNIIDDVLIKDSNTLSLKTFDEKGFTYNIDNSQNNTFITFELKELTTWKKIYGYSGKVTLDKNYNIIKEEYSVTKENLVTYEEYADGMYKRLVKTAIFTGLGMAAILTFAIYITIYIIQDVVLLSKEFKAKKMKNKRSIK